MKKVHFKQMQQTQRVPGGTRLGRCLCMSVAAVAMIRCAQAHADTNSVVASRDSTEGTALHRAIERNTELTFVSFTQAPVTPTVPFVPSLSQSLLLSAPQLQDQTAYSSREFRPRGRSIQESDASFYDTNSMRSNPTVWQQMGDYRGHGRVRVLTLWESTGGTVSLQAGKNGSPSLQWTSSWMSRGDAKRGVLDSLFAVSIAGAANTIHSVTHTGFGQGQTSHDATKLAAAAAATGPKTN